MAHFKKSPMCGQGLTCTSFSVVEQGTLARSRPLVTFEPATAVASSPAAILN